MVDMSPM